MDNFSKHWAAYPRQYPSPCPLLTFGDLRGKDHVLRETFSTYNFSFILRGRGHYQVGQHVWEVQAPCVITQWPGQLFIYGPRRPRETWDELYFIYDAKSMPWFQERGFIQEGRPLWPIRNLEGVNAQIEELRAVTASRSPELVVDRIDRIAERLVLESLLPGFKVGLETDDDDVIQNILLRYRQHPEKEHDFAVCARKFGLSPSTLRRRWSEVIEVTPGRYLLNLRVQKARRLLAETNLQVGEVAAQTGFEDMLYFSRRFKLETSLSPSQYRVRYGSNRRKKG